MQTITNIAFAIITAVSIAVSVVSLTALDKTRAELAEITAAYRDAKAECWMLDFKLSMARSAGY